MPLADIIAKPGRTPLHIQHINLPLKAQQSLVGLAFSRAAQRDDGHGGGHGKEEYDTLMVLKVGDLWFCMEYNANAVKAGVGLMASIGLGLGLLLFFLIEEVNAALQKDFADEFGPMIGFVGMILAILFCPIVASIVGAIISKNFDDEGDAAFNGAITGAIGTVAMFFVAMFVMSAAVNDDDSDLSPVFTDLPSTSDLIIKGAIPSAISGALGAYVGFKYLWSQMPDSERRQSVFPPASPPQS